MAFFGNSTVYNGGGAQSSWIFREYGLAGIWIRRESSVELLREASVRYLMVLGASDPAQERFEVERIRSWTELIAAKAAPLVPESALQLIPKLGRLPSELWVARLHETSLVTEC